MTTDKRPPIADDLPDGWTWTTLEEVAEIGAEQILPLDYCERQFNYLALENISQGTGEIINFAPTLGAEIKSDKFKFTPEHVLYGKLRPYLRKAVAPDFDGISATDLLPLKPATGSLDRYFLVWWLLSPQILEYVVKRQTGVKMPRLRSRDLKQMPVPLPPPSEQKRIVAKIEALFTQSRRGRDALDAVPDLLTKFRRAVLAAAFRGALTQRNPADEPASVLLERIRVERRRQWEEDLRAQGKDPSRRKYKEPAPPDTSDLPELPEGWVWTSVNEVAESIQYGYTAKSSLDFEGPHYLRITDIQHGSVDWSSVPNCEIEKETLPKYLLKPGDIVFARSGATAGKSYLIMDCPIAVFASYLIRVQLFPQVSPEYLYAFFGSKNYWDQVITRGNAQPNANARVLGAIKFPLPPFTEQRRIVARIEALFAQADVLEAAATAAHRRLEQVDQAILVRAFRGELVEQDPEDEPAEVLLERVRAEQDRRG